MKWMRWWIGLACCCSVVVGRAEVTPMDEPVRENSTMRIEVEYKGNDVFPGGSEKAKPGVYHYTAYIPKGYDENPQRRYPCMFSMKAGLPSKWLQENRWIYIQLKEAQNGPWPPIMANFCAAHDDAVKRFRIAEGQKFSTGVSGGSRGSSVFVRMRPGFAGLWCQAAGVSYVKENSYDRMPPTLSIYATFGCRDGNLKELNYLRSHSMFAFEIFDGGHNAAPKEQAARAMEWFTEQIYLKNPQTRVTAQQAAWFLPEQAAQLDKIQPDYARYRQAVLLQSVASKFGLAMHPPLAPALKQVNAVLLELTPKSMTEKMAQKAFQEAQLLELRLRTGGEIFRPKSDPNQQERTNQAYQQVAAKYPGTEYGQIAADRVETKK